MFLKVKYGETITKLKHVDQSIDDIRKVLQEKFAFASPAEVALEYNDADNDVIHVSTEDDWKLYIEEASSCLPKSLMLTLKRGPATTPAKPVEKVLHSTQNITVETAPLPTPMPTPTVVTNSGSNQVFGQPHTNYPHPSQPVQPTPQQPTNGYPVFTHVRPAQTGGLFGTPTPVINRGPLGCFPIPVPEPEAVHSNITCDECKVAPLRGIRYKSVLNNDFDLCANCKAMPKYKYEMMLQIPIPITSQVLTPSNFSTVANYFVKNMPKKTGVPTHNHHLLETFKKIFVGAKDADLNKFLWTNDGKPYEELYGLYIQQNHCK